LVGARGPKGGDVRGRSALAQEEGESTADDRGGVDALPTFEHITRAGAALLRRTEVTREKFLR